jgi:uncharacterized membrane protein
MSCATKHGSGLVAVALATLAALGRAASGHWTELDEVSCPPDSQLSYENFAAGFFAAHCNTCHSVGVDDRRGAPRAYVFDSYEQAFALRERVFLRSAADNSSMPPGPDDPPVEERDMLAEWIACGAPKQ